MPSTAKTVNRTATDRLRRLIGAELGKQEMTTEEIAREARLPSKAFRSLLRHGHRPSIDRADALLKALGTSMRIGVTPPDADDDPDDGTNTE